MTTRDPRSRDSRADSPFGSGSQRDPTQSLSVEPDEEPSHPSLALGTHEAHGEEFTKAESPGARSKTPMPAEVAVPIRGSGGQRPPPTPRRLPDDADERVGHTLGSYRVVELLGKGGMGYVFRAEHVKLGREVALKLLRSDYSRRRDAVARFFQEARTVNRVRHRNIVDVTDFVELDDGTTFIIMELLSGQSLGRWARTGVDMPRALAVLCQICDGLGAAHAVGVVHRDLKPDNVIVVPTSDGAELVKLLDFGVAKLLNRDDEDVGFQTAAGSVIGTPAYMSPEQAGGMAIDARSDAYSLGAIMYELFCGQPMFRGRSFGEYVRKHLTELPPFPHTTEGGRNIDPRLEALILKCLEKDPNQRFGTILELRDGLLGILGGMETHPPQYATLTGTGPQAMRSSIMPPSIMQAVQPPPMVPTAPPMLHVPTPASGMHSQLYSGQQVMSQLPMQQMAPHYTPYSQIMLPPPPTQPQSPWWLWFIGGAVAVGLGVAAAIWYAGRGDGPTRDPNAQVVQAPAPTPPAPVPTVEPVPPKPAPILVHFDSDPTSGGIFADGKGAELCRTPCDLTVEAKDGSTRTYVVRVDGYQEKSVAIDVTAKQREFKLVLDRQPTISAKDATKNAPKDTANDTTKDAVEMPSTPTTPSTTGPTKRVVKIKGKTSRTDKQEGKQDTELIDPTDKTKKPLGAKTDPKSEPKTDAAKTTPPGNDTKKPDAIDPTNTHNPFKPK